ncbi:MAG: tyrosine-type recombinase/integrase [Verrucomicrobia bacterium]|nr:tyrosine-type recombinase/integrase [Verrucomicrobiota bacterium]
MSKQPTYKSPLADMMERFIVHKRLQGFDYTASANSLRFFDRFLCGMNGSDGLLLGEYFPSYLETLSHLNPKTKESRLGVVHQFSLYLNAYRPESWVMPLRLLPVYTRNIRFYRITATEVCELMHMAEKLPPKGGIRCACIHFLIGLLYTTGLRISEATGLNLGDVDLERNTLFIHRGKFGKDRLIAFSPSTRSALDEWLCLRSFHAGNGNSAPLFVSAPNKRLTRQQASRAFKRLCKKCGLQGEPPPRLHDLRHNYASECLTQWQHSSMDVETLLPVLSTAMGHVNPCATQRYIHINASTLLDASEKIHDRFTQPTEENQ